MGRRSTTGGVTPVGSHRIRFDFTVDGVRLRPTLKWLPNEANLRRARAHLERIRAQIEAGTFCFSEEFPDYCGRQTVPIPLSAQSCADLFDNFLAHEEARVERGDLAPITLASHRQILNHVWRPHLGHLPLLGIRHSMLVKIADTHPWNKKPTTMPSAHYAARSSLDTRIIRRNATLLRRCEARASARRIGRPLIPSAFRMPKPSLPPYIETGRSAGKL
jgi:Arm DNA-binding domain